MTQTAGVHDGAVTRGAVQTRHAVEPARVAVPLRRRPSALRPNLAHRSDIDGLRGLAVLAVVLFHAEVPGLQGGYVGVDVFFVISGYLITQRLVAARLAGGFSAWDFYARRIRRLLPALLTTVAGTLLAGWALLPLHRWDELGRTALASVVSLSNVLFWRSAGYWEPESLSRPLLHTWSLSVEEQFYLVWPAVILLLLFTFGGRRAGRALAVLAVGALAVSVLVTATRPSAAFYLTPFRVHEFALGGLCVWADARTWPATAWHDRVRRLLVLGGVGLVLLAVVAFDEATAFPGVAVLVPALGTVAVILARAPDGVAGLMTNRPLVRVGLISYSLYLVHWPVLVLTREVAGPAPAWVAAALVLTAVLSQAQHRLVEQRFRLRGPTRTDGWPDFRRRTVPVLGVVALTVLAGIGTVRAGNDPSRYDLSVQPVAATSQAEVNAARGRLAADLCAEGRQGTVCGTVSRAAPNVLVIGDSQGQDGLNLLAAVDPDRSYLVAARNGCPPVFDLDGLTYAFEGCAALNEERFADIDALAPDLDAVVVASRINPARVGPLLEVVGWLQDRVPQVVVLGVGAEYEEQAWQVALEHGRAEGLDEALARTLEPGTAALNDRVRTLVEDAGAAYLDRYDWVCPDTCRAFVPGTDQLVVFDQTHLTRAAVAPLASYLEPQVVAALGV